MLLPCSSNVDMQLIGFPSRFPSPCSLVLCFLAGLCLFLTLRFVIYRHSITKPIAIPGEKEKRSQTVQVEQKSSSPSSWRFFAWEGLPVSLPITLTTPLNTTTVGRGVGVTASAHTVSSPPPRSSTANYARSQSEKPISWHRRGPSFEQPGESSSLSYSRGRAQLDRISTGHLSIAGTSFNGQADNVTAYLPPSNSQAA
ncbi:hypothetical protein PQX77_008876 [Marasmius sp. AFHP31]|nr:hypothetical protein PQX77_008876 [Marasmius sp. AFHP31]